MDHKRELSPVELAILLSLDREQLIDILMGKLAEMMRAMFEKLTDEHLLLEVQSACQENDVLTMYAGQQDWQSN